MMSVALAYALSKLFSGRLAALLMALTLLSGCSILTDVKQLITPSNAALLIVQNGQAKALTVQDAGEKFTHLKGVRVDPKQIPVTPSRSIAIEKDATDTPLLSSAFSITEATLEQAQKTLIRYLAMVEEQPERIEKLLTEAEQLAQRYPDDSLLQSLWQRLSRYSDWQPVNSIISSAGIDLVSFKGWQPESPFIRARRALLPPMADNEHIVFGDQRLVLLLVNQATVSLHVDARLEDIPFLPQSPVVMLYQVDDNPPQHIALADKEDWKHFSLAISAGEHAVRFYQQQSVGNQYIKLRFDETGGELAVTQERPYFISTAAQPLAFYAQGPTALRIDELDGDTITYRYQNVPEGWQTISLPPSPGKPRSLLRVSQRVVNLHPTPPNNRVIKRTLKPVAEPEVVAKTPVTADKVDLIDAFKLGKQEDGTLSAGLDFVRRNNTQESVETLNEEQFSQYRVNYRYFDEQNNAYWNTQGFLRIREHGDPSFGFEESIYYNPDWLPFNIRSNAKIIAQVPHDKLEALGQWNLTLAQAYNLHPKTRLIPSLTFFARAMSLHTTSFDLADLGLSKDDLNYLSKIGNAFEKIDQDVFTPYKSDHTAGLIPALTLEHRPWLDTVWSTKFSEGSNEDFDITLPDYYKTEVHWQQLLGNVTLDASYRITFFQGDDYLNQPSSNSPSKLTLSPNRKHASKRSYAGLELNWQQWTDHQNRLELAAQYSYDIERKAHLATLSFTYHFGEGRGLRDFAPGEIDFRDIRQRQFVDGHNNLIRDADQCAFPCLAH
ncbi:hypothetical protein [Methyloglobulus sp.]|uniref:hypothetical protein n=1 Tax=Methyloglobulus sp. TaxID=2518622 RepID=UPI0032B73D30